MTSSNGDIWKRRWFLDGGDLMPAINAYIDLKRELGYKPVIAHEVDAPGSSDGEIAIDQGANGTPSRLTLQACGSGDGAIAGMDARPPG